MLNCASWTTLSIDWLIIPNKKAPAKPGPSIFEMRPIKSARIEFDDQMRLHLHRERHVGQRGMRANFAVILE